MAKTARSTKTIWKFPPVTKVPHMLHGGDYNPEQWIDTPEIWREDMRLMKLAGVNVVSLGIFAWSMLEPEEGKFNFGWLDRIMDMLADNGVYVVLATPSGAKPNWMAAKYPEIRRINARGEREPQAGRHNHCYTSPVYREKVTIINTHLAQRYRNHPALIMWHVSNEYGGECYCPLCKEAFREFLKKKYGTLDRLNRAWWTTFWSHRYTDWSQIDALDGSVHGLILDWKRFVTHQTVDFMRVEIAPLKKYTPNIPVTTNMMGTYPGLDYWKFADVCDVIVWDNYPRWHREENFVDMAARVAFVHDLNRSIKHRPFLMLESTPSQTNWADISPLKRPGVHVLSSLQAVAHGSDSVMYFQWRKSRGSCEKFHGAVVDHCGHEHTRVFRDVQEVGRILQKLDAVVGTTNPVETAVIFDWENRWAFEEERGPRNVNKDYEQTVVRDFYRPLWLRQIPADVINMDQDFSPYRLLIAPILYMVRPGVAERIARFVKAGGTFVTTYFSGLVDENDLCFLGGFPGPLREILGIWVEEHDALADHMVQSVQALPGNELGLTGSYAARHYCDLLHCETAQPLAVFGQDFYAGRPAVTVNYLGKGRAFYIASRNDDRFHRDLAAGLIRLLGLRPNIQAPVPEGVSVQRRSDGKFDYLFFLNCTDRPQTVPLDPGTHWDMIAEREVSGAVHMPPYGTMILRRPH